MGIAKLDGEEECKLLLVVVVGDLVWHWMRRVSVEVERGGGGGDGREAQSDKDYQQTTKDLAAG